MDVRRREPISLCDLAREQYDICVRWQRAAGEADGEAGYDPLHWQLL